MITNYLKIAVRNLFRHKIFSSINILGLAIGMAACMLILLFIQRELSFEKEHGKADRIYRVLTIDKALGTHNQRVGITMPPLGPALQETFPEVEASVRLSGGGKSLLKYGDQQGIYARKLRSADGNFFDLFDFRLLEGDRQKALTEPFSIVLTRTLARQIFGSEEAMGKTIRTGNGYDAQVTGVMQDLPDNSHLDFDGLLSLSTQASVAKTNQPPNTTQPIWLENWDMVAMPTYVLLKQGALPEGLDGKFTKLCRDHGVEENFSITLQPLRDVHLHSTDVIFDPTVNKGDIKNIYIFAAIALLILIIAIVNYMNLSTARSTQRAKEVGMRKVVGSSRRQLIYQFMGESLLLTFLALLLSFPLAEFSLPLLNHLVGASMSLNLFQNGLIVIFLFSALILVGLLAGFYPAIVLSNFKPVSVLKGSFASGQTGIIMRKALVVFQFTLSIALIGLTVVVQKQMYFVQHKDLGYNREQVVVFDMTDRKMGEKLETFRKELAKAGSFVSVAASSNVPGRTFGRTGVRPEGASERDIWIWSNFFISPETIPTLGMKMAEGRNFSREMGSDTSGVVIINQTAVKQLGWKDPLSKKIYFGTSDSTGARVIGVVKDFHFLGLHQPIEPVVIFPLARFPGNLLAARIQAGRIPEALNYAGQKWQELYPDHPFSYTFLDDEFNNLYRRDINTGKIVNIFSILAIFIACLGLFSLSSHSTAIRIKEIGVRKVLGASTGLIIRLLVIDFIRWVLLANIFAWPLAWFAASKWLNSFAYRIPLDPLPFLLASILALLVAVLTVLSQSWRAAVINPARALRYE
ncbi:MAG: ABC transporter permease [Calditrichia bacterium]